MTNEYASIIAAVAALGCVSCVALEDTDNPQVGWDDYEIKDGIATFPFSAKAVRVNGCTGTMVSPNWVLTAAHCFGSKDPAKISVSFLSETRTATHLLIHPQSAKFLGSTNADLDVAMVRIATPFSNLPYTAEPLIYTGDTSNLLGDVVHCFGYGAEDFYGSCETSAECASGDFCKWGVCMPGGSMPELWKGRAPFAGIVLSKMKKSI